MICPATTRVTLPYGYTDSPYSVGSPHAGVDFSWEYDKNIYAPEDGSITFTGWMGSAGQATELKAGNNLHRMCHQSQILVTNGQQVKKGQIIGIMGDTGNFADGSPSAFGVHLHWVMWVNGVRVNGLDYVNEGIDMVIPDADNYYWRYGQDLATRLRGRQLTRDEFRQHIVGQTDLRAVEILSDDPEAVEVQYWQDVGRMAVKDNWEGQIYGLVDQVHKVKAALVEAENKPPVEVIREVEKIVEVPAGGIDTDTKNAIQETNAIVKAIQTFLSKIFK